MKRLIAFAVLSIAASSALAEYRSPDWYARHGNAGAYQPHNQHSHRSGLRTSEAVVLGVIGGVILNEAVRPRQPQPVYVQPTPVYIDQCASQTVYQGVYNPGVAQSYCRGLVQRQAEQQRLAEIEAYQRGVSGQ